MARHYGIPYMGSKQKLVDRLIPFIIKRHPGADSFYDLFGGGGSVALYTASKYPSLDVVYSELSKAVSALMAHLKDGGEIPFEFISRSEFEANYRGDDWYAGLLQTCWTFGNNQHGYLYGSDLEQYKKCIHELVVDGVDHTRFISEFIGQPVFVNLNRYTTMYQRRIVLQRQIGDKARLQHIERLERLLKIIDMPGISTLGIVQGKSYDEVDIIGVSPVVYCDPPYENTAEYREGGFDHEAFYDWVMSRDYPVYVSSYKVSDERLKLVYAKNTRSLLGSAAAKSATYNYERLYWNGVGLDA